MIWPSENVPPNAGMAPALPVLDPLDNVFVAALGAGELRPLALGATAVLVAKAAQGREHGGAIDVIGRGLGRPRLGLRGGARILLRRAARDRECERQNCEHRAVA